MKRTAMKRPVFNALLFVFLIAPLFYLGAETLDILTNSAFPNPQMPDVRFQHDRHNENAGLDDCTLCHHTYENDVRTDESSEDTACAECHRPALHPQGFNLAAAYHTRCRGCHLEQKRGPVACGECHRPR